MNFGGAGAVQVVGVLGSYDFNFLVSPVFIPGTTTAGAGIGITITRNTRDPEILKSGVGQTALAITVEAGTLANLPNKGSLELHGAGSGESVIIFSAAAGYPAGSDVGWLHFPTLISETLYGGKTFDKAVGDQPLMFGMSPATVLNALRTYLYVDISHMGDSVTLPNSAVASIGDVPPGGGTDGPTPLPGVFQGEEGHYYQALHAEGITWERARQFAEGLILETPLGNLRGHLVTISDMAENDVVEWVRLQALNTLGRDPSSIFQEFWIGLHQPDNQPTPDAGWLNINGEGVPGFLPWCDGEPNDAPLSSGVAGVENNDENSATIGLIPGGCWNDEGKLNLIVGFIVEYDILAKPTSDPGHPFVDVDGDGKFSSIDLLLPGLNSSVNAEDYSPGAGIVVPMGSKVDAPGNLVLLSSTRISIEQGSKIKTAGDLEIQANDVVLTGAFGLVGRNILVQAGNAITIADSKIEAKGQAAYIAPFIGTTASILFSNGQTDLGSDSTRFSIRNSHINTHGLNLGGNPNPFGPYFINDTLDPSPLSLIPRVGGTAAMLQDPFMEPPQNTSILNILGH